MFEKASRLQDPKNRITPPGILRLRPKNPENPQNPKGKVTRAKSFSFFFVLYL